ncbi:putative reverse transcriptase [Aspergillus affinis]|uniref:putative reverse transcriptase n=1 Tax=Aspergillus affinis TaxID=1070780 RepID=UPI0022FE5004|nr:putative reverse transcriptase [Aspergillus affinis]KAI9036174.1 putative reverse transcriptase [Aspergillus affinis]
MICALDLPYNSKGIPVPKVYGYSSSENNPAGIGYIVMEKAPGAGLESKWSSMSKRERHTLASTFVEIEQMLFNIPFGATGSIYFKKDVPPELQAALHMTNIDNDAGDETLCIGPTADYMFWYGKRAGLDLDRGPCYYKAKNVGSKHHLLMTRVLNIGRAVQGTLNLSGRTSCAKLPERTWKTARGGAAPCPFALLNTLGKILEAVATVRIAWALEERNLLPRSHLGGRRGISVDHLIQLLLDQIFESWGKGRKVSILLLDVAGAFDNVSHIRLLHNLRMIGLGFFAGWLKSFLSNRSTRLQLPGYLSNLILTPTGIPQGPPISPILFLLFNTPLIRALSIDGIEALRIQPPLLEGGKKVSYGWIDDVATLTKRTVPQEYIYTEPWQGEDPEVDNWDPPVEPPGHDQLPIKDHATGFIIKPVEHAKYLGIWLDRTLSFDTHRVKALAKANGTLEALRSISGSTWGTSLLSMRRIYLAVVVPQLLYGAAAWYSPTSRTVSYKKLQKTVNEFQRIQIRAAVLISGAFRPLYAYRGRQEEWETRRAHVLAPWELPLRCIIEGAEEAVQTHDRVCREDRQIWYTDGSGYQGMIGAAAVSIRAGRTARKHLGTELDSTVYVGELEGARMALDRAKPIPITVFSDSQAAIQAVRNPGRPSGQYALRAIYGRIRALRSEGLEDAELRWIPSHIGVKGNEKADKAAKEAAIRGVKLSSVRPRDRPIIRLAAAAKRDAPSG